MASAAPPAPGRLAFGIAATLAAAAASAALLLWAIGSPVFAAAFAAGLLAIGTPLALLSRAAGPLEAAQPAPVLDQALLRTALEGSDEPLAVTDADGSLVAANAAYEALYGSASPAGQGFEEAVRAAHRDGRAIASSEAHDLLLLRSGDRLVWRFTARAAGSAPGEARALAEGTLGDLFSTSGIMTALAEPDGRLLAANRAFLARAGEGEAGGSLADLIAMSEDGRVHFAREGKEAGALRLLQVPVGGEAGPILFLFLDDLGGGSRETGASVNGLLEMLPLGLALADRDGRLVYLNAAFRRAASLSKNASPTWPSDLVVDEDKAAVADSVRRFARGPTLSGDIAVRLKTRPEEPVALTVAGARGLGEAAVLLSLKDNSEEDRLKRQVAQATKMQAVGQLAGGVAHDFNNILTAIIGHCDLMLMRHAPGDSDYDDIQQIRSNSNRAASLTRQLLAFSRQQTLRPQVLQLPDVISEVSNLLKRLLGETVKLTVKHGRNLGAVRADPGQLEQVIVNLAVNARDAMPGGGILTVQTYSVT
ncbi:MAG TPA: PAS domain-containing protein, partial [Geminicoccaceae bacterium]